VTLRSPRIVTVQLLKVAESQPIVRNSGMSPGSLSPGIKATWSVTIWPSENWTGGHEIESAWWSEHVNPFGPVTVPPKGPLRFSPWTSVTESTCADGGAAPMVAVTVCPAMVAVNVCAPPLFAAAVRVIVAPPVPDAGETLRAGLFTAAVHVDGEHPAGAAVSVTVCDPPPDANETVVGDTLNEHGTVRPIVCFAESPR